MQPSKNSAVTPRKRKIEKIKIRKIKINTPEEKSRVIPKMEEITKSDIEVERTSTYNYNTISSTKRVNHVTTFKNAPKHFHVGVTVE